MRSDLVRNGRYIGIASLFAVILFAFINFMLTDKGLMSFSGGSPVFGLSLQSIIYNFLFVVLGLGLYEFLNFRFSDRHLEKFSLVVSNMLLGICIAFGFFAYGQLYTLFVFTLMFLLLIYIEYFNRMRFMYRFYRVFVVLLLPVWFVNYILINRKSIRFNSREIVGFDIGSVPVENYIYAFTLLLVAVFIFEKLRFKPQS